MDENKYDNFTCRISVASRLDPALAGLRIVVMSLS